MEDRRNRVIRNEKAMEFEREQKMKEINDRMKRIDDMKKQKIMIDELTREVREHNNFAQRVPVIEEQIKVAKHRIEDLEREVG